MSLVTSCFTGSYIRGWTQHLPGVPLQATPLFDGRAVCYPTDQTLRDYLAWRQADTHINTQYNTCYWALVKAGKTPQEAQDTLRVRPAAQLYLKRAVCFQPCPPETRRLFPALSPCC